MSWSPVTPAPPRPSCVPWVSHLTHFLSYTLSYCEGREHKALSTLPVTQLLLSHQLLQLLL